MTWHVFLRVFSERVRRKGFSNLSGNYSWAIVSQQRGNSPDIGLRSSRLIDTASREAPMCCICEAVGWASTLCAEVIVLY